MKSEKGLLSFVVLLSMTLFSQDCLAQNKVRWMTLEEALKKQETKPKKILIDIYTEWCKFCKKMETMTLGDDNVAKYINEHYYAVKFDAEQKESLAFNGEEFNYVKSYPRGYHEFAFEILGGKITVPSIVILDENTKILQSLDGYKNVVEMEMILQYYGTDSWKNISWRAFSKTYQQNLPINIKR
jgi:thioredoxin-related protein